MGRFWPQNCPKTAAFSRHKVASLRIGIKWHTRRVKRWNEGTEHAALWAISSRKLQGYQGMAQKNQKTWGSTTKYYKSHTICCVFTLSTIQSLGLFGLFWAIPIMLCCGYNSASLVLELLTRCSFSSKQGLRNSESKLSLWSFLSWLWVKKYDVKIPWIKLTIKPGCVPQSSASNLRPGNPEFWHMGWMGRLFAWPTHQFLKMYSGWWFLKIAYHLDQLSRIVMRKNQRDTLYDSTS